MRLAYDILELLEDVSFFFSNHSLLQTFPLLVVIVDQYGFL